MLVLKIKDKVNLYGLDALGFENDLCSCLYKINNNTFLSVEPKTRILKIYHEVSIDEKEKTILQCDIPGIILKLVQLDLVEFIEIDGEGEE